MTGPDTNTNTHTLSVNASVVNFTSTAKCCVVHTMCEEKKRNSLCNKCMCGYTFESRSVQFSNMIVLNSIPQRFRALCVCSCMESSLYERARTAMYDAMRSSLCAPVFCFFFLYGAVTAHAVPIYVFMCVYCIE